MKEYDKEGWWEVCKEAKPDLTREEFEMRWAHFWHIVEFVSNFGGPVWSRVDI